MSMRVRINVMLHDDILDPQGQAIEAALKEMGFEGIEDVRQGKIIMLTLQENKKEAAKVHIEAMCEKLLVNKVIESYEYSFLP